jgi:hypothetical protein
VCVEWMNKISKEIKAHVHACMCVCVFVCAHSISHDKRKWTQISRLPIRLESGLGFAKKAVWTISRDDSANMRPRHLKNTRES